VADSKDDTKYTGRISFVDIDFTESYGHDVVRTMTTVMREINEQNKKWGEQNHPSGTHPGEFWASNEFFNYWCNAKEISDTVRTVVNERAKEGNLTWLGILLEEVTEAFAEEEGEALITELTQVAAVAMQWAVCIRRRQRSGG
jgi:hypothetical protein